MIIYVLVIQDYNQNFYQNFIFLKLWYFLKNLIDKSVLIFKNFIKRSTIAYHVKLIIYKENK